MPAKQWRSFFLYLGRVFILLILLAVLLPKFVAVCNIWMSSLLHSEQKPIGNPLRVEEPGWSKFVIRLFPATRSDN
ncbi:MAG TPA: hypothetical protein VIM51_05735 [Desulfosporosinus sp.]